MPENHDSRPPIDLGPYEHYKGGKYEVLGVVLNKTDNRWDVVYHALGDQALGYSKSYVEFTATVEVDGRQVPRYRKTNAL